MTKALTTKPPGFKAGLSILALFSLAIGACGVFGWAAGDNGIAAKVFLGFLAGITACVIPLTVIVLGRSASSFGVLLVLALAMGMQAVSFHNFYGVAIEAPHKAAFDAGLQPLRDEVTRTTGRLEAAQAALDAVEAPALPERCRQVACPNTVRASAEAYAAALAPKQTALDAARAERSDAIKALGAAEAAYRPLAPDGAVWLVGGLLDLAIALAIWSLEATARKLRRAHEAKLRAEAKAEARRAEARKARARERREAARKARERAAKAAARARPASHAGFPKLAFANDN